VRKKTEEKKEKEERKRRRAVRIGTKCSATCSLEHLGLLHNGNYEPTTPTTPSGLIISFVVDRSPACTFS
jgi:hypothetical protein